MLILRAGSRACSGRIIINRMTHILYIHSHDTGRYVQPYGHPVDTPTRHAREVAPAAARFLASAPAAREPFFLSVGFEETHRPYPQAGPAKDPRYCLPPPGNIRASPNGLWRSQLPLCLRTHAFSAHPALELHPPV